DADTLADLIAVLREREKPAEAKEWEKRLEQLKADKERLAQLGREMAGGPRDPTPRPEGARIMVRHRKGEDGGHLRHLARARDQGHRPTHQTLAEYYQQKGNMERARQHRQLAGP